MGHTFEGVSLNKYSLYCGLSFADSIFDAVDSSLELPHIQPVAKSNVDVEQDLFRTKLHRQQITDLFDCWILLYDLFDSCNSGSIGALSEQQGSTLAPQNYCYGRKQKARSELRLQDRYTGGEHLSPEDSKEGECGAD